MNPNFLQLKQKKDREPALGAGTQEISLMHFGIFSHGRSGTEKKKEKEHLIIIIVMGLAGLLAVTFFFFWAISVLLGHSPIYIQLHTFSMV